MRCGVCIYAECHGKLPEPMTAELVTAARLIKRTTGEAIQALVIAENCVEALGYLERLGVDEIYAVDTKQSCLFKDDLLGFVIRDALERIKPSAVLIPAGITARSVFSRAAALMGAGLTADCTELIVVKNEAREGYYLKQNKPSFGDNVMVSIITKERHYPQMMTIRQGVYPACPENGRGVAKVFLLDDIEIPESKIEILETTLCERVGDDISAARILCVAGRGSLGGEKLALLREFAAKIGGVVAGTRPLADEGIIAFENQIGQTGKTVRPKICISFGVSGAIQHTEGIKDAKLFIAVNNDENAAIFNVADYGVTADMEDILRAVLSML